MGHVPCLFVLPISDRIEEVLRVAQALCAGMTDLLQYGDGTYSNAIPWSSGPRTSLTGARAAAIMAQSFLKILRMTKTPIHPSDVVMLCFNYLAPPMQDDRMRLIGLAAHLVTKKSALSFPCPLVIGTDIPVRVQRSFALFHVFVFCAYAKPEAHMGEEKKSSIILSVSEG